MSRIMEYLKLIPRGLKNLPELIEGVTNQVKIELGVIPEEDLEIIVARRILCSSCPFMSVNAKALKIYTTEREDEHCMHCGCPIPTRTASLESNCGIEVYNAEHLDDPLTLKWEKVTK